MFEDGADDISSKGLVHSIIEIADGVYVYFYNIHIDAYDSENDRAIRQESIKENIEVFFL